MEKDRPKGVVVNWAKSDNWSARSRALRIDIKNVAWSDHSYDDRPALKLQLTNEEDQVMEINLTPEVTWSILQWFVQEFKIEGSAKD